MKLIKKILYIFLFVLLGFVFGYFLLGVYMFSNREYLTRVFPYDFYEAETDDWADKFTFTNIINNNTITIANVPEKVVFINFWATWCAPCIAEMPSIAKLKNKFQGKPVRFVIASDESKETIQKSKKIKGIDLPFYRYDRRKMPLAFQANGIPATFLVVNGEVVYSHVGMADWNSPEFVETLQGYIDRVQK